MEATETQPLLQREAPRRYFQWKVNMVFINFLELVSEATRGLALPSLYIYQTTVGGDVRFMAFLTAVFSVGRVISSTLFGVLSDHYGFT